MVRTILLSLSIATLAGGVAACGGSSESGAPHSGAGAGDTSSTGIGGGGATGSGGGTTTGGTGGSGPVTPPEIPFACPGGTIAAGSNTITVNGKERKFFADLPSDTSGPMGVLFSWHGYGDDATSFKAAAKLDPDGDPAHPLVILTPEDSGLQPPNGLGWDIAKGKASDPNVDLPFFEGMLGCLNEQYSIDPSRVYSFGFSAGAVFTNLIHSRYPKLIAAIVTESGAWMNDPEETKLVKVFTIDWSWPALDPADRGDVLLTHGGPNDVTVFNVFDLEEASKAALPFLAAAERTVVECAHDEGHTLAPDVTPEVITKFLTAHRAGEPSPYAAGMLPGFPASCTLRLP